jgi:transcriptional regulator with XRE-family HTH domain
MTKVVRHFLKEWRTAANQTQQEVADAIGYERSYYSRIETGKRGYDQEILERLAKHYSTSPCSLISQNPGTAPALWEIATQLSKDDLVRLTDIARALHGVHLAPAAGAARDASTAAKRPAKARRAS